MGLFYLLFYWTSVILIIQITKLEDILKILHLSEDSFMIFKNSEAIVLAGDDAGMWPY